MNSSLVFLLAFGIGLVTGLRSMTGPALVCWAAHLGWLNLEDARLAFMESTVATYGFSALALGELVADKLPFIPNRTSPGPLFGRVVLGALSGAAICVAAGHSAVLRSDPRRSRRSDRSVCGISGTSGFGEEVACCRIGWLLCRRHRRGWRRPFSGFATSLRQARPRTRAEIAPVAFRVSA